MNRKVTYARTHQGLYIMGAGDLGNVFPSQSKTLQDLEMKTTPSDSLVITFNYRGIKHELLVPSANIVVMQLAQEHTVTRLAQDHIRPKEAA